MVERQRREHRFLAFMEALRNPGAHLKDVGDHVAVRELRSLGDPRRASGVLKEGEVGGLHVDGPEAGGTAY